MKLFVSLWNDEAGFIVSSELILISALVVLGLLVGLATIRDQVVQELGDTHRRCGEEPEGAAAPRQLRPSGFRRQFAGADVQDEQGQ